MSQTIFITGASSGIGKATAKLFQAKGWNVAATMRTPANETELNALERVLVTRLDVTDAASIEAALEAAQAKFGHIDVLLNNAGYGTIGPLEAFSMDRIERQFNTNVIGLIATTKAVIPHFRARNSGTIINVSSIGGRMAFPFMSLYHGTKWAVEGLSEAMYFEMEAIGVKVKIVEPGGVATDFGGRSFVFTDDESLAEYQPMVGAMKAAMDDMDTSTFQKAEGVAEVIWDAVNDDSNRLRFISGDGAKELLSSRYSQEQDEEFLGEMRKGFGLS